MEHTFSIAGMGLRNIDDSLDPSVRNLTSAHDLPPLSPYLLIVDNNEDDVFLLLRELRLKSFRLPVMVLHDGVRALEFLTNTKELPLAVLVAYRLPGINGVEVIQAIRADDHLMALRAVLLTSSQDERAHVCGLDECNSGANACLVKPLTVNSLVSELERLEALPALA